MRDADDTFQQFFDCCNTADRFVGKELVGPSRRGQVIGETPGQHGMSMRAACFGDYLRPAAPPCSIDQEHSKYMNLLEDSDMTIRTGLNPYGLTYYLGLQGKGTDRANPNGKGLDGFLDLATELEARVVELPEA